MKPADYALIFLCVLLPFITIIFIGGKRNMSRLEYRLQIEEALYNGVNSAVSSFETFSGTDEKKHIPDATVNEFLSGTAAVLGRLDDPYGYHELTGRVPVICLLYEDGYIMGYIKEKIRPEDGTAFFDREYTPLMPYYYTDGNEIYVVKNAREVIRCDKISGKKNIEVADEDMLRHIKEAKTFLINNALSEYCSRYGQETELEADGFSVRFSFFSDNDSEYEREIPENGIIVFYYDKTAGGLYSAAAIERTKSDD